MIKEKKLYLPPKRWNSNTGPKLLGYRTVFFFKCHLTWKFGFNLTCLRSPHFVCLNWQISCVFAWVCGVCLCVLCFWMQLPQNTVGHLLRNEINKNKNKCNETTVFVCFIGDNRWKYSNAIPKKFVETFISCMTLCEIQTPKYKIWVIQKEILGSIFDCFSFNFLQKWRQYDISQTFWPLLPPSAFSSVWQHSRYKMKHLIALIIHIYFVHLYNGLQVWCHHITWERPNGF